MHNFYLYKLNPFPVRLSLSVVKYGRKFQYIFNPHQPAIRRLRDLPSLTQRQRSLAYTCLPYLGTVYLGAWSWERRAVFQAEDHNSLTLPRMWARNCIPGGVYLLIPAWGTASLACFTSFLLPYLLPCPPASLCLSAQYVIIFFLLVCFHVHLPSHVAAYVFVSLFYLHLTLPT